MGGNVGLGYGVAMAFRHDDWSGDCGGVGRGVVTGSEVAQICVGRGADLDLGEVGFCLKEYYFFNKEKFEELSYGGRYWQNLGLN
nr:hypothetical protein Iba_chr08aCG13180 [Ipomoea batatas]